MSILFIHPSHTCGSLTGSMTTVSNGKCVKYILKLHEKGPNDTETINWSLLTRCYLSKVFGENTSMFTLGNNKGFAVLRKTHIDPAQDCLGRIPHASHVFSTQRASTLSQSLSTQRERGEFRVSLIIATPRAVFSTTFPLPR